MKTNTERAEKIIDNLDLRSLLSNFDSLHFDFRYKAEELEIQSGEYYIFIDVNVYVDIVSNGDFSYEIGDCSVDVLLHSEAFQGEDEIELLDEELGAIHKHITKKIKEYISY